MSSDKSTFGNVTFTANDMKILATAWQCMETEPKIDYGKMAELGGWTKASATTIYGTLRKKIRTASGNLPAATTPKTPRTPKRKAVDEAGGANGNADGSPTLAKRGRKPKPKPKKGSDEDDEYANPKIIKKEVDQVAQDADAIFRANGHESFVDNSQLFGDSEGHI